MADDDVGAYLAWVNMTLKTAASDGREDCKDRIVSDIATDFCDGVNLLLLLDILREKNKSKNTLKKINMAPKMEVHRAENCMNAFHFMEEERVTLVNIGNMDIVQGNVKLTSSMLLRLMEHYHLHGKTYSEEQRELLAWIQVWML